MISKTQISAQKPCGRQINAKMCGIESRYHFCSFFLSSLRPLFSSNDNSQTVQALSPVPRLLPDFILQPWRPSPPARLRDKIWEEPVDKAIKYSRLFITKLMLITARSYPTTQRPHSYKFILVERAVHSIAQLLSVAWDAIFKCCTHAHT